MRLNHAFPKDCRAWYRGYEHWKRKPSMIPQHMAKCLILCSRLNSEQLAVTTTRCRQVQTQWATGTVPWCVWFFPPGKTGGNVISWAWGREGVVRNWEEKEATEGPQGEQRPSSKKDGVISQQSCSQDEGFPSNLKWEQFNYKFNSCGICANECGTGNKFNLAIIEILSNKNQRWKNGTREPSWFTREWL